MALCDGTDQGSQAPPEPRQLLDMPSPTGFAWSECALIPPPAFARCAAAFTGRFDHYLTPAGTPAASLVASLQCLLEALVFSERVGLILPARGRDGQLSQRQADDLHWLDAAVGCLVPMRLNEDVLLERAGQVTPEVSALLTPEAIAARIQAAGPVSGSFLQASSVTHITQLAFAQQPTVELRRGDDGSPMLAVDLASLDGTDTVTIGAAEGAQISAAIEFFDTAIARQACDETGMRFWAVTDSPDLHVLGIAHADDVVDLTLDELRRVLAQIREHVLARRHAGVWVAGTDLHCSVNMGPVLLSLLSEARDASDLIGAALRLRQAAVPFRRHLAALRKHEQEADLTWLYDWHLELQRVCDSVAATLGARPANAVGSLGSVALGLASVVAAVLGIHWGGAAGAVGGVAAGLATLPQLVERMPGGVRRQSLQSYWLSKRQAFLRDLVHGAAIAPDVDRELLRLFG